MYYKHTTHAMSMIEIHSLHIVQSISRFWVEDLFDSSNGGPIEMPVWVTLRCSLPSPPFKVQCDHSFFQVSFPLQLQRHQSSLSKQFF